MTIRLYDDLKQDMAKDYLSGMSLASVAKKYSIPTTTVYNYLKGSIKIRTNRENSRKYAFDEDFFSFIDNESKAYWLGFIWADGYIVGKRKHNSPKVVLAISEKDHKHLDKYKEAIKYTGPIRTYNVVGEKSYSKESSYCRISIVSEKMFNDLVKIGLVENKSNIITPPLIEEFWYKDFIRGFVDGNGSIVLDRVNNSLHNIKITSTISMLDFILSFARQYNIGNKINVFNKRKPNHIVSSLTIGGGRQVRTLLQVLYGNATVFLTRKYRRYLYIMKNIPSNCTEMYSVKGL